MASISKNVYIDKLYDVVNKCNNRYHRAIVMNLVNVNSGIYVDFDAENNNKGAKFEVCDQVRICKNSFAKGYNSNWSEEVFVIKKFKILFLGHLLMSTER